MADLLNTNIKKNLVQTKVTTKQNSTTAKTASTAQTTAVKSTTKLTSTQVNAGIASGTLSASKAISTLKSDLSANVTTTKTANNKTVAQTTVGGKTITINTNAKDVPITTANTAIPTAKSITTKMTSDTETKSSTNDSGNVNVTDTDNSQASGIRKAPSGSNDSGDGEDNGDGDGDDDSSGSDGAKSPDDDYRQRSMTEVYDRMSEEWVMNFVDSGGMALGAAQAWETGFQVVSKDIFPPVKDGIIKGAEFVKDGIEQLGQNVADKFVIHDYSQGKTNDTNNSTGGSGSDNYAKGGTDTKEPTVTFNDDGSLSTWSKGFGQYGGSTVDTGNGTSVEFGPVTAIGTSENDSGGYNGIYTDGNGDVVAVSGSNGNGEKNIDGIGGKNNYKPGDDWTDSNGTKHHMNDDGSVTSTYKNGKTIIYYPDGTEEIIDSNSTSDDVEGNESAEDSEKVEDEEDENDKKDKKSDSDGNKKSGGGGGGYTAGMSSAGTAFDNFTKDLVHSGMSYLQYQMKKNSSSANDFADNWGSGNNTTMRHA